MTKRDFFILLIKVVGLFILLSNLFSVMPRLSYITMLGFWESLFISVTTIIIVLALFILLVKKADWVVDKLHLTKGFDDDRIELGNPNKNTLIQLTIHFIGGYLLVDHIPAAILQLINLFMATVNQYEFNFFSQDNASIQVLINLAAVLIGYLLLTNSSRLAKWLMQKSNNKEEAN